MDGDARRPDGRRTGPHPVARRVLQTAIGVVLGYETDTDPLRLGSAGFLRRMGRAEDDFTLVPWTVVLVRAGFELYARCVRRSGDWLAEQVGPRLDKSIRRHARNEREQAARVKGLKARRRRAADWRAAAAVLPADGRDERVIRYEAHLNKWLHSTLHELERMQAARAGRPVVPPVAVDVTVDLAAG